MISHVDSLKSHLSIDTPIKVILNPGGFTRKSFLSSQDSNDKLTLIADAVSLLHHKYCCDYTFLVQTMPPFPWLQGGSCFHNVLVSPASISKFYKITNLPICLDVSHSFMASSFLKFDFIEFVRDVLPYTAHLHLSDASSFNREGLQIGDGLVPLSQLFTLLEHDLPTRNSSMSIIRRYGKVMLIMAMASRSSWNGLVYTYEIHI